MSDFIIAPYGRLCSRCSTIQPDSEFRDDCNICRTCRITYSKNWRRQNPACTNRAKTARISQRPPKGIPESVLVDDDIRQQFSCYSYFLNHDGYPIRKARDADGNYHFRQLARDILGLGQHDPLVPDHINGDVLDNRRVNLRAVTRGHNAQNLSLARNNKSGYAGVSWNARERKWLARGSLNGKRHYLGSYDDRHEAGRVAIQWRMDNWEGYVGRGVGKRERKLLGNLTPAK